MDEVPTKASPYVESAIRPLTAFREVLVSSAISDQKIMNDWLQEMVRSQFLMQRNTMFEQI